jgi:oxygen-independent coproporphyrinogen III oxidase
LTQIKEATGEFSSNPAMDIEAALAKYDLRVPRYTSYPTAAQFSPAVGPAHYAAWLAALPDDEPVSLYLHVPFCDALCLYCGCNTAVVRRDAPKRAYAQIMQQEIALVARLIGRRLPVAEIHWGGGTPTALPAACLTDIMRTLRQEFDIGAGTQISVELDPRYLPDDALDALRDMGMSRASLGVQDFDPMVQQAIGRVQSVALVQDCIARLRDAGARSINFDLIYGLPYQTAQSVRQTVEQAVALRPDRIAAFGYAHVPWMKRHQTLMPEAALPDSISRFRQRAAIEDALTASGYHAVGLDHYALPDDTLAQACGRHSIHRNFQGYTTDNAAVLLGFGASSIGSLPQGHVQNVTAAGAYMEAIRGGALATARGVRLTQEDRLRGHVIEQIMCQGHVDLRQAADAFGADARELLNDARALRPFAQDGLVKLDGACVDVTGRGRPFLRSVAAAFDAYWERGSERHAAAV